MRTLPGRKTTAILPLLFLAALIGACRGRVTPSPTPAATPSPSAAPDLAVQPTRSPCAVNSITLLAEDAVGPSWIPWDSACLPDADLVYTTQDTWNLWVMDETGGNKRCLTCYGDNALGANFPLDEDGASPEVHWKGDPDAHPAQPIIIFKAENEFSGHRVLANSPSIGWDNDLWALNVCTRRYARLTRQPPGEGLQHTAIADDGAWFVFPRRYDRGSPPRDFGLAALSFHQIAVDQNGDTQLTERFEIEPNGPMYYEPIDIRRNSSGSYTLLYVAGTGNVLDPYRYEWTCAGADCSGTNDQLLSTPATHEEFTVFSPSGAKITSMQGPLVDLAYHADLYVSAPDFTTSERVTWFNDCGSWPDRCRPDGAQLSRMDWKGDGTAVFFGLWTHEGPLRPANRVALYRLDFAGRCGG